MKKEIICTLGPASMNERTVVRLEELGVNLFRINLSHTRFRDLEGIINFLRSKTSVPLCLDTEGAQIRTGNLSGGEIFLKEQSLARIQRRPVTGDAANFNLYPLDIIDKLRAGDHLTLDFNSILVQVIAKEDEFITIRVLNEGLVGQNKAVSLQRDIDLPALTEKDFLALSLGKKMGINHAAISFVNQAADVSQARKLMDRDAFIISKIETIKGMANLEKIAEESDALLLDRGDLSRQVPIESIPAAQKDFIRRTKETKARIYVATNLLESMVSAPVPTRAEVNDIFNTLVDGADGLVLAAETAIGSYPVDCAVMVSRVIKKFLDFSGKSLSSDTLIAPHGGRLINRVISNPDNDKIKSYKALKVDKTTLLDLEQIAIGTFSPIEGFMKKQELESVLKGYRLLNGEVWTLPIILQVNKQEAANFKTGETVSLASKEDGWIYGLLHIEDIYTYDLDELSQSFFQTKDPAHPGPQSLRNKDNLFLGGKIDLIKRLPSKHKYFEFTPAEAREIFKAKGWTKIVAFHTRNVIHRAHEHIQNLAFRNCHCDGLFIHPVIGPKKRGDYRYELILKTYELMINKYYPKGKAVLGGFSSYSRYGGPREAVFTALCRKNFGCSHFIVGRDHTGVGNYYEPDAAAKLFAKLGDIGIKPIFFNKVHYCRECNTYVEECSHENQDALNISGTEARQMLQAGKMPPAWFMREGISQLIIDEIAKGEEAFI